MNSLLDNAIHSIQIGVEDYGSNDVRRTVSAVRNLYAGILLLAKEVLIRAVPNADPEEVIGSRYKPVPDGRGGVHYEPASRQTVDFVTLGQRFADFDLPINNAALKDLNGIRNDIEHKFTEATREAVREAIAKAFPVVVDLFRLAEEQPSEVLGDAWQIMLDVRIVYEGELEACRKTFERLEWPLASLAESRFSCPKCDSDLVAQDDPNEKRHEYADCNCRACGERIAAERALELILEAHFDAESHYAAKDGGEQPVQVCSDCGSETYVLTEERVGCLSCGLVLEECARCMTGLTPENVDPDNSKLCGYCGHLFAKDD